MELYALHLDDNARLLEDGGANKAILVDRALQAYNTVRIERAKWLVRSSRYVGEMYEWQDARVGSDHVLCAAEIEWRCRKIWDYDVDEMMRWRGEVGDGTMMSDIP